MSIIALKWAYSRPITNPVSKNILAFLASHNFPGNRSIFKVSTICSATAYSERAVRGALKELLNDKYLIKKERFAQNGQQLSNEYILNIPDEYVEEFCNSYNSNTETPLHHVQPPPAPRAASPLHHVHPLNNKKSNNKKNKSFKSFCSSTDERFTEFWNLYPRKQSKKDAMKDWSKIDPSLHPYIMADVINRMGNDIQWQTKQYIPLPASYLRGECWNDEIITEKPKQVQPVAKPNEVRSTVPWANPQAEADYQTNKRNHQPQEVNDDKPQHRAGNQFGVGNMLKDKTASVSKPAVVGSNEASSPRSDGVKIASAYLLPHRHSG